MDIKGKLTAVFEEVQVTDSFKKREFVIEYAENPQYPELIKLEMIQDKCSNLDKFEIGQEVAVAFNLKGRKWIDPEGVDKYFNTLQAWKVQERNPAQGSQGVQDTPAEPTNGDEWLAQQGEDPADDLPF